VINNPDSHLSGYFRTLRSLLEQCPEEQKGSESDMANGSYFRGDQGHESNISLSAPEINDKEREGKIKRDKSYGKREKMASLEKM